MWRWGGAARPCKTSIVEGKRLTSPPCLVKGDLGFGTSLPGYKLNAMKTGGQYLALPLWLGLDAGGENRILGNLSRHIVVTKTESKGRLKEQLSLED